MKRYMYLSVLFIVAMLSACVPGQVSPTGTVIPPTGTVIPPTGTAIPPAVATPIVIAATPAAGQTPGGAATTPTTGLTPTGGAVTPAAPTPAPDIKGLGELEYIFEIPADPIGVTPSLDSERRVEAVIATTGGSLSASGADGAIYKLDIPAGALVVDTLVRMTPLSTLEGMPFGSGSYAVQLEPEGLQFYEIAVLTITPPADLPVDQQIFFGYQGEGEDLVLAPPVVDSKEMKIQVLHFSGYGVTKGFLADMEPLRARIGGEAEARLSSALAEQLSRMRQEQLLGIEDGTTIDWAEAFRQWEEQVVKPRIAAAGESCAAGRLAIQTVLGYERQRQLLGMAEDSSAMSLLTSGLMDQVAETCMKEEYELCRDDHIIHRIIPAWLGLARQYALLGMSGDGSDPVLENAKNYARRCLTFELEYHSEANFDDGGGGGYTSAVESKIKMQLETEELKLRGQAPLVNTSFQFRVPTCRVTSVRGGGTFGVMSLSYVTDTRSPTDELGYVRDWTLIYFPGNTSESFTVACPDSPSYTSPPSALWTAVFWSSTRASWGRRREGSWLRIGRSWAASTMPRRNGSKRAPVLA